MKTSFDFEKLGESNKLIHKWIHLLGWNRTQVYKFAKICKEGRFGELGLSPHQIYLLQQDVQEMSYTWEIENDLIDAFKPMILYVANKMKVSNVTDDIVSRSLVSIRKAVFYFRNDGRSFKTFAYYAVTNGFRQSFDAVTKVEQATILETDLYKDDTSKYEFSLSNKDSNNETAHQKLVYLNENITFLASKVQLSEMELLVMKTRLSELGAYDQEWAQKIIDSNQLTCSKSTIYKSFRTAAEKLREIMGDIL